MLALLGVVAFWAVGAVDGIGFMHDAHSPLALLTGLYVMLAVVSVSIIIATLALTNLVSRSLIPLIVSSRSDRILHFLRQSDADQGSGRAWTLWRSRYGVQTYGSFFSKLDSD
jgi:hypothetical protein